MEKQINKIKQLFSEEKKDILSIYFTAGFPTLDDTTIILAELQKSGVDLIEVGIPFSDPLADGPTIQHSSEVALKNGMTLNVLFQQLEKSQTCPSDGRVSNPKSEVPLILMGYLNPVLQFGVENFCKRASQAGVSGVILPDLPLQEYLNEYKPIFEKYGILNIFLITPQTSEERIRLIDKHSNGFIYMVSSSSTTGVKDTIENTQASYFKRIKAMNLKNPLMIGFGIADNESFRKACDYAHGAIIGSAFIGSLEKKNSIHDFIKSIR